jgi:hypothetical protein
VAATPTRAMKIDLMIDADRLVDSGTAAVTKQIIAEFSVAPGSGA